MEFLLSSSSLARSLLSGGGAVESDFCFGKNVTYEHRVDNPEGWNWCLTPDGGFDAVLFAALAIAAMCLASPRWDALVVLFFGGIYFTFSHYFNLEHVSNAVALWLGMRPADIFVFVFLPPFLLDLSVRIDFFMLKKVAFNIAFMAFVMVAASALILIPFMLYALDLQSSGWTAGYVALFGSMIASTDAASVSAVLRSGGGPEILSVLLEGESLFNDASSLTLFEIFKEVVEHAEKNTLAHDLQGIVVKTIWSAFTGICIGLAMGIVTRWIYAWLQHRNMEAQAEVAWSVAGAYLSFYITQVWCKGSGCIGSVAFGLYGSATLLWGMSTKARLSGIFSQFWAVMTFIINGLIFFYVGASSVNFTIRSSQSLYDASGGIDLVKILLYKLPLIFLASFALRFIMIFSSFKLLQLTRLSEGMSIQEVIFVTVGGLRGSLSLVLAQSAATMASSNADETERRVKAEIAIYTAGYVVLTLLVNAPLCGPLLTLLGLDKVRQEQLAMRGEVKNLFRKFTSTAIEDLVAGQDEDELLQGLDWATLRHHTDFDKHLDKELPEVQPSVHWFNCTCDAYWRLVSAPGRLWRWARQHVQRLCAGGDSLEREMKREDEAHRQKEEADLRRATNFNIRDLANASRAPGSLTLGQAFSGNSSFGRSPTAIIIRDALSTVDSGGRRPHHANGGAGTVAPGGRRTVSAPTAAAALRNNNSRRVSTMVVSGATAAAGGDVSVRNGGHGRANTRFLEGAVAGPVPVTPNFKSQKSSGLSFAADGQADSDLADGLAVQLPPPPAAMLASFADNAAAVSGGGILDPHMVELTEAKQATSPANGVAPASPAGAPTPAEGETDAALPPAETPGAGPDADSVGLQSPSSPALTQRPSGIAGAPPSPMARGDGARPGALLPRNASVTSLAGERGMSRFAQGAQGSLTRTFGSGSMLHSASAGDLQAIAQMAAMAQQAAAGGADGAGRGGVSQGRARFSSVATAEQGEEAGGELLQSILVIRPGGAGAGRSPAMPLGASGLRNTGSVRLVQRLGGEDGRDIALEAMRAGATGAAGARALGRSSVRAPGGPSAALERTESESGAPSPVRERPLGRGSVTAATGRPLGRTSAVAQETPWEPPSLGPFEFALPEDVATGVPVALPAAISGRASMQRVQEGEELATSGGGIGGGAAGGGGGALGRSSVRIGGAGGGALGRASVRMGRQGLASASVHLARIYDADAGADLARNSQAPSGGGAAANPILSQVASIAQREQQQQQQQKQQQQLPQREGSQHQKYQLGTSSKNMLMSLIRRSASPGGHGASNGGGLPTRDHSGRGSEGLARRTRFADSSTAAALARASASSVLRQNGGSDVEGGPGSMHTPLLVEYRMRLLAGLKQYYRQKHAAGSLSNASYKVLSYVADQSAHEPEKPLNLWSLVRQEVGSGAWMQAEANVYFKLKHWTAAAKRSENVLVRGVVPRLLVPFVALLSSHISATTLRGLETAVELWASLTQSLQTEWLQYSGVHGELLLEEVQHEADGAWSYIIERRIEAPNKFGAVQTHRAVIDVLTQQQAFVREMNEGGMIDESECRKIVELVERRLQLLARRGPRWRQPTVSDILSGTPFLRGVAPRVVDWIRKQSQMVVYQQGAAIWDMGRKVAGSEPDGLIIVVRGVVRMMVDHEGTLVPYYLGAGGVGGLVSCVLEQHVPGMSSAAAYAEGNAMGKGPVVMHIPYSVLQVVRRFSREEGMPAYQALELQLYRTAAVYVLDLLRHQVTQQFSAFIRSSLLTILGSQRIDGPTVRRQRIRLLLQPAAADHHVDGGIDWISELLSVDLDTARMLLDPPSAGNPSAHGGVPAAAAAVAAALAAQQQRAQEQQAAAPPSSTAAPATGLPLGRSVVSSAWVEAMYKAIAAATGAVLDVIRGALKDAVLVVLRPGQGIVQKTTMVLIQGSLEPARLAVADGTGGAGGGGGPFVASPNELHVAPSVMVWVSDYFEGELVAQKPLEVVAGSRGATLLVWGLEPEGLLVETKEGGSGSRASGGSGLNGVGPGAEALKEGGGSGQLGGGVGVRVTTSVGSLAGAGGAGGAGGEASSGPALGAVLEGVPSP